MVRLLGAVLVASGCAWVGFQRAAGLTGRVRALREMAEGIALLEQELELDAPPLSTLMERLSRRCRGSARALFSSCGAGLERLDQEGFAQLWRRLVAQQGELGWEGQECLASLGAVLGQCDLPAQLRAVDSIRRRLEEQGARAEEDSRRQGKVYRTLGLSGGAFLVTLLM